MRAANGGECWSLTCYNKSSAPPGILKAVAKSDDPTAALPVCAACGVAVAGLLTLPCRCPGEVCGECFVQSRCDKFELTILTILTSRTILTTLTTLTILTILTILATLAILAILYYL
jgi:hypothetical protein